MIYGSSQGSIVVTLTRWDTNLNSRVTVATASRTLTGMAMSWATFSINFSYVDGNNPDSCIIVLKASGTNPTNNDYLWVDNLGFAGNVVGMQEESVSSFYCVVFPNPATDILSVSLSLDSPQNVTLELVDFTGRIVVVETAGMQSGEVTLPLDISEVAKGSYLIRVVTDTETQVKSMVIN